MLQALVEIGDQSSCQQALLTTLLSHGRADSVMLKALSVVATVCLPASLIAVSKMSQTLGSS